MMKVIVTGGAGYIGSHVCLELLRESHDVVVIDNLSNSSQTALQRVQNLSGRSLKFHQLDILDEKSLDKAISSEKADAVIHMAGFKAVGESVSKPLSYYHNNVTGTLTLCKVLAKNNLKKIIFSSSATVYAPTNKMPVDEHGHLGASNPYGRSKVMIEEILQDLVVSDSSWSPVLLRYFNPVGADESGEIGESPNEIPNNLMPYICQVASGKLPELQVFGDDYETVDGTGVRDYIHVMDLASGHVKALDKLSAGSCPVYNLGTGRAYSVLQVIAAFEKASGKKIPYKIVDRRSGDIGACYADPRLANRELDWKATRDLETMCADAWRWQSKNPEGYDPS
jgi:UDP-glucose 4-epimerase